MANPDSRTKQIQVLIWKSDILKIQQFKLRMPQKTNRRTTFSHNLRDSNQKKIQGYPATLPRASGRWNFLGVEDVVQFYLPSGKHT